MADPNNCRHLQATCRAQDPHLMAFCPSCKSIIPLYLVINNLMAEIRSVLHQLTLKEGRDHVPF